MHIAQNASSQDALIRLFSFGERYAFPLLAGALVLSTGLHAAIAGASVVTDLHVDPEVATCHSGETILIHASARTPWGSEANVTHSATWTIGNTSLATMAATGLVRCISEGNTEIAVGYGGISRSVRLQVAPAVVMVDVAPEPPPPPPPPPAPEPEPQPEAAPAPPPEAKVLKEPPAPAAAKAGNLLTAPDDKTPSSNDEPATFVTDPNGDEYGSGVVAKGGTAEVGLRGAVAGGVPGGTGTAPAAPPPPPPPPAPVAAVDLSRRPSLIGETSCDGYFPSDADDDVAQVQVVVTVKPTGEVTSVSVAKENPKGQGFGRAARNCLMSRRFSAGLDRDGKAVLSTVTVALNFRR